MSQMSVHLDQITTNLFATSEAKVRKKMDTHRKCPYGHASTLRQNFIWQNIAHSPNFCVQFFPPGALHLSSVFTNVQSLTSLGGQCQRLFIYHSQLLMPKQPHQSHFCLSLLDNAVPMHVSLIKTQIQDFSNITSLTSSGRERGRLP